MSSSIVRSIVDYLEKKNKSLVLSPEEVCYVIGQFEKTHKMPLLPLWEEIVNLYLQKIDRK